MHEVSHEKTEGVAVKTSLPRPIRVLMLEDDAKDAELCVLELIKAGLQAQLDAVDTRDAFEAKLRSGSYDVILSDYRVPGWSGVDAFRLLRDTGKDIPFILVTGSLGEETTVDLIKQGIADYILKDRLARLPSALKRALQDKTTREERERAIIAQRESEELVRLLLDSTAEAICGVDVEGNCTFCNAACARLLGYERSADLLGQQMHRLTHHTRTDGTPYSFEECRIQTGIRAGEDVHVDDEVLWRRDGSCFPVEYWAYPMLRDGKRVGAVLTFLDITERKRADLELRKSEARVRCLVDSNVIGIVIGDADGRFVEANGAFLKMTGFAKDELLSSRRGWNAMTPAESREADQRAMAQLRSTGIVAPWEKEIFRKDGVRIPVLVGMTNLVSDEGNVEYVSFVLDISDRKHLERQLRQAQKMEAVGQLAGGIAHDFNNLLSIVIGYSEVLLDRKDLDDQLRDQCEEINKAGHRAASLTRQLLAFGRQQVLEPKVLNLNSIVIETEKMLARLLGADIELRTVLDPKLGSVKADPGQMQQIIMNLVVNARDAMPDGGKLTIETGNAVVDENSPLYQLPLSAGRYVLLCVTDTGIGMDEDTKARIFEPFFTTKAVGRGSGLGLSTVYGVVKQSGGHVCVYSDLGRWSVFKIYLPQVGQAVETSAPNSSLGEITNGTETVLLVEDDASVRKLTRGLLEGSGYTVIEAGSGAEALEAARNHAGEIHVLLSDIVMPGMNGRVLAQRLTLARPGLRVVYISGHAGGGLLQSELLETGGGLLQKPFSRTTLLLKIREALNFSKESESIEQT